MSSDSPDAAPPSRRRDALRNKERLLEAARELIAERGAAEVPLEEIAKQAGVGIATLYRNFPTRDDLIRALYDQSLAQLAGLSDAVLGAPSAWDGIVIFAERVSELLATDLSLTILIRRMGQIDPDYRPAATFEEPLRALVAQAKIDGDLRDDVTAVDLPMLVIMSGTLGRYGASFGGQWRRQIDFMLDGIRAEGKPRRSHTVDSLSSDDFHAMVHDTGRKD